MNTSKNCIAPKGRLIAFAGSVTLLSCLTGCGMAGSGSSVSSGATPLQTRAIQGSVHGGQQPVSGASIQLYAVGKTAASGSSTGYGTGATALITSTTVTSDANGNFSITGDYTCPSPATQVYLVATGGNPGLTPSGMATTVNNTGLALMAALGTCPAGGTLAASIPFLIVNEVTTVAAVWSLQQFMAAPATANKFAPNIGAPTTTYTGGTTLGAVQPAVNGLVNAFTTSRVLADFTTGASPNYNYPYATPETAKINTIADIIAYCVNSDPSVSSNCSNLFTAATPSGKTAAADTIQAAWYMAQNPINNLTTLYGYMSSTPPFQPIYVAPQTLNSTSTGPATNAFNDTTLAINYAPTTTAGAFGLPGSYAVAIDAFGNAWFSNTGGLNGSASVSELGVDGSLLLPPVTTFTTSATGGSASQYTTLPSSTHTFAAPKSVAVDLNNGAWVANEDAASGMVGTTATTTGSVAVFTGSTAAGVNGAGGGSASTGFLVGSIPWGVAIDGSNNVFVANTGTPSTSVLDGRSLAKIVPSTGAYSYSTSTTATTGTNALPGGQALLAVDTNTLGPFVWADSYNTCKVQGQFNGVTPFGLESLYLDSTDQAVSGSEIATALSNATPGAGSTTNCGSTSVYIGQTITAGLANPYGIAIDHNNGAWISDVLTSSLGFDGLTYISAPTTANGGIATSVSLVNGVQPTSTTGGTAGTTLTKAGADAVDGNNNVWVANQTAKSVVEASLVNGAITLLTPGQGSTYGTTGANYGIGFAHNTGSSTGIAIDPSGNVWVTNASSSTYTNQAGGTTDLGNSATVIVGAAGPVVTPLSLAIKSSTSTASVLGAKP